MTNPHFRRHVLIFLGGLQGLEPAIESDESLKETEPRTLFDYYLNTCPNQGSRTIRTEVGICLFSTLSLSWFVICFSSAVLYFTANKCRLPNQLGIGQAQICQL